ncbi:2-hydroxychromene-2-carboxylate isomerase [Streptomyces palmae]|uniref:2-hydroxychromene-2-carboxylate isomerase n=1 Tax=Streptomyces palmae TaxID=1701085 RepID=A0A4Z0G9K1_9ACTN|nr:DsbA family protein [Streptomyces palmae]TGA92627.1 2-hydroxychromene-2-carboxylate isomerase [Streptomyces palmae]
MAGRRSKVPRFYFNFRSPYSWLAYRDLMDRYPDVADVVEWHPWWEPDERNERLMNEAGGTFSYVHMSREKHLYILQDVRRLTRDRGLPVSWPVDEDPVWEICHLPYFLARDAGLGREYIERVYRARWLEGRNICERETVAAIAADLGLPVDKMTAAADDEGLRRTEGLDALLALSRDGAFGVPFFTHGYDKFWGVDRLPAFVESVRARMEPSRAPAAEPAAGGGDFLAVRSGDQGHEGGCG